MMISGPADIGTRLNRSGVYAAQSAKACSTASTTSPSVRSGVKFSNA